MFCEFYVRKNEILKENDTYGYSSFLLAFRIVFLPYMQSSFRQLNKTGFRSESETPKSLEIAKFWRFSHYPHCGPGTTSTGTSTVGVKYSYGFCISWIVLAVERSFHKNERSL